LRIKAHDSKTEIRESLISHYGEYISYNPSINHQTYALWFGPLLMLMIGSIAWLLIKRRR
ncbi:MAG: cytochrome c-type biogenesis protein CcmH, partial [Candidatus Berkiella sp.]